MLVYQRVCYWDNGTTGRDTADTTVGRWAPRHVLNLFPRDMTTVVLWLQAVDTAPQVDFMGFNGILWGFNGILWGLMGFSWGFYGI